MRIAAKADYAVRACAVEGAAGERPRPAAGGVAYTGAAAPRFLARRGCPLAQLELLGLLPRDLDRDDPPAGERGMSDRLTTAGEIANDRSMSVANLRLDLTCGCQVYAGGESPWEQMIIIPPPTRQPDRPALRPLPISDPDELRAALRGLPDRDRQIIELRYGLKGSRFHSRAEIGRLFGLSRERIRQLENRAVDRLGAPAGQPGVARGRRGGRPTAPSAQSFLRCWTLLLLWLRPGHVYELRGRLTELGLPTAFYRTLQGLERDGLLRSSWEPGRGAGPKRRVYRLTELGVEELKSHVEELSSMSETLERFLADERLRAANGA